jgi:uncharacterized repeat protein (TIGR02543 family)
VKFNTQGGSVVDAITANQNTTITAPVAPTRTGYTFGGWYKDSGCKTPWSFSTDRVTRDITLYTKWLSIPVAGSISAVSSSDGKSFKVTVGNVTDADGVSQVQLAVWSEAEGVGKAKWYNASKISGTSNWQVTVPVSDHGNYYGKYTFRSFGFDALGCSGQMLQTTNTNENPSPAAVSISAVPASDGKSFTVTVNSVTDADGVSLVQVAAWNDAEGVNQAKWYNASRIGGTNNWRVIVPVSDHANYTGNYTFKSFGFDNAGKVGVMLITNASIS